MHRAKQAGSSCNASTRIQEVFSTNSNQETKYPEGEWFSSAPLGI